MTLRANTVETQEWRQRNQEGPRETRIQGRGACSQRLLSAGSLKAQVILSAKATALPICWALWGFVREDNGNPLQYSCLENPMDGGVWWAAVHGVATERLHFHFSLSCIGEGNGSPLQCSCLENPRDGGAWWAAVYGVAQRRTQLKRFSSSSSNNVI